MKLIGCILAGAVFAQEQTTIYSLDDISLDELARGRKKKKQEAEAAANKYGKPIDETTKAPPTTTPIFETLEPSVNPYGVKPTTAKPTKKPKTSTKPTKPTTTSFTKTTKKPTSGKPGQYGGGTSGAYGDPHFHIVGISADQPDLCFDFNGAENSVATLLADPATGFRVEGKFYKPDPSQSGIYFQTITVLSGYGTRLTVTGDNWTVDSPHNITPSYDWKTEMLRYGDMVFGEFHKHGGAKISKRMDVMIPNAGTFQIQVGDTHNNVNFKVLDTTHLSSGVTGVLGKFLPAGAYEVKVADNSDLSSGYLF